MFVCVSGELGFSKAKGKRRVFSLCDPGGFSSPELIIQHMVKELASLPSISTQKFRVMIIDDADQLSHQAQAGAHWAWALSTRV